MRTRTTAAGRRAGFTLVEVLVAAGLCILIMTVMATAFQAGLDTLSQLKSLGGLQTQLRTAETALRRDLQAEHLESPYGNRVSDQRLDRWVPPGQPLPPGQQPAPPAWEPPTYGFFRIYQEPAAPGNALVTVFEGNDQDGLPTTRATGHVLHMAVKLPADRNDTVFDTTLPGGLAANNLQNLGLHRLANGTTFRSQWAEVVYFLDTTSPAGFTSPSATQAAGLPYYSLHRRVRLLTEPRANNPLFDGHSLVAAGSQFQGMSWTPIGRPSNSATGPLFVNPVTGTPFANGTPGHLLNDVADITNPHNRLGGIGGFNPALTPTAAAQPGHSPYGSGRYNVGYVPPALGPHVVAPPAISQFDILASERSTFPAPTATGAAGAAAGTDILMSGVVSFEVRVSYDVNPNVDRRYNRLFQRDTPGGPPPTPLANTQQTQLPPLGNIVYFADGTPPDFSGATTVQMTAAQVGHSTHSDGAFDDLPPAPFQVAGTAVGNPLFHRPGDPPGTKPRVFDLWGTNLLPVAPAGGNVNHADWHLPLGYTTDNSTTPATQGNVAANPNCVPLPIRVKAIQIKLRVYDPKNKVTRQLTLVEAL